MTQKQIESFRKAFATTVAAFEFADTVSKVYGGPGINEKGQQVAELHKAALAEMEKENPDGDVIASLITQMEVIAAQPIQKFPPGGMSEGWENNDFVQGGKFEPNNLSPGARVISREENESL